MSSTALRLGHAGLRVPAELLVCFSGHVVERSEGARVAGRLEQVEFSDGPRALLKNLADLLNALTIIGSSFWQVV